MKVPKIEGEAAEGKNAEGRNRTADAGLFRAALYQLSYLGRGERGRAIPAPFQHNKITFLAGRVKTLRRRSIGPGDADLARFAVDFAGGAMLRREIVRRQAERQGFGL